MPLAPDSTRWRKKVKPPLIELDITVMVTSITMKQDRVTIAVSVRLLPFEFRRIAIQSGDPNVEATSWWVRRLREERYDVTITIRSDSSDGSL
jgi:hypothetical protein